MTSSNTATLVASALVLAACAHAPRHPLADPDRVAAEIIAADNAGDLGRVAACYARDAVLLPPGGPEVRGRAAIRARYAAAFDKARFELEVTVLESARHGAFAFNRGLTTGRAVPRDGGPPRTMEDRYLMLLRRGDDGRWRISHLMWGPLDADPDGP